MSIKQVTRAILARMGYTLERYPRPLADHDISMEKDFLELYEQIREYTMVSVEKSFALYKAVQYICRNNIPGDFVECGVWRGGQSMLMSLVLQKEGDTQRRIYLYDTYSGMVKPQAVDVAVASKKSAQLQWDEHDRDGHNEWCYAPLDEVKAHLYQTGYPRENLVFIEGDVKDTIPGNLPEQVALLRLDTDWYESTYHELVHVYPRLVNGGVLLIDDYGTWEGSRKATDQYLQENELEILLTKVGGSGRITIKHVDD